MRYDRRREAQRAQVVSWVVCGLLVAILAAILHLLYHREYADAAIPNDCFAVAATAESALPKQVCLTFDDGPSSNTQPLLDILAREKVPATFFVCAQEINREYLPLVRTIVQQGHQVAMHSASHRYATIYRSTDAFWQDIKALRQTLQPYLNLEDLTWLRFPGGSTNTISHRYGGSSIMRELKAQTEEKAGTGLTGMYAAKMPPRPTPMRTGSCGISRRMPRGFPPVWCCCTTPKPPNRRSRRCPPSWSGSAARDTLFVRWHSLRNCKAAGNRV